MEQAPEPVRLPERIRRLNELAHDLWWSWNFQARSVFRSLDYLLWRRTAHNPVLMLSTMPYEQLEEAARNPAFVALYDAAIEGLDRARAATTWSATRFPHGSVAYFSAEFALHQSLPIYAGGLGVLAGDHCKEASDLGIPLVGVGFMYPQGYFHQKVSSDGRQEEVYEQLDWTNAPIGPAMLPDGRACVIAVPLGARTVLVSVWRINLGRVKLFLLDTNLEENAPWDRTLSARLYGGDRETRVQQEIVLGIGGVRALRALGEDPFVWHLNEGHASFVVLQRIREAIEQGHTFAAALEEVRRTTVFTTHTPVPAGHDAFPFGLVETHLAGAWGTLGKHREDFLALGLHDNGSGPLFNMTALAMRSAGRMNAVSRMHCEVTREMWAPLWNATPADAPIRAITNGIHLPTWVSAEMTKLFDQHLHGDWRDRSDEPGFWRPLLDVPDEDLWTVRRMLRSFLFAFIRERARRRWTDEQVSAARVVAGGTLLDPEALTIGFARRFTAYKRPQLIFHDTERLSRILTAFRRPVQIVFAGKAHPADDVGKHHLRHVFKRAVDPAFAGRIAFLEDYDLHVARFLVQGCDVWLNTPRRPLEASGTSGMKASVNGVPHLSIADGWWAEGYNGANGWVFDGGAPGTASADEVDAADAAALYAVLETEVVPTFYERDASNIPRRWLRIVKQAICSVAPQFSSRRMLKQYEEMYTAAGNETANERGRETGGFPG